MRLPFSMMAATIPPAATRPTLGRQGVEPIRQRRKGGDCLVGPRPLRLQTCGGGESSFSGGSATGALTQVSLQLR
jgi:hypothetical protein